MKRQGSYRKFQEKMDKNKVRETKQNAHKSQLPISLLSFQNAVLDLAFMLVTG